jgi:hypothetical protein
MDNESCSDNPLPLKYYEIKFITFSVRNAASFLYRYINKYVHNSAKNIVIVLETDFYPT